MGANLIGGITVKLFYAALSYFFTAGFFAFFILALAYPGRPDSLGALFAAIALVSGCASLGFAMLARS